MKKQIPETREENLVQEPQKWVAGGAPALVSVAKFVHAESGWFTGVKALSKLNQKSGFDCPGCAWPDPEHRTRFEFCENGAKAVLDEATAMRVTASFFERYSIAELSDRSDRWLNSRGRIERPMYLAPGAIHYAPVSWQRANDIIAQSINSAEADENVFYTSGRTSNEAAFMWQLFARKVGTNNLPDCSNMCHESSGVGLSETIGIGKGTVLLEDFDKADAIFVFGQNPGTNHPRMLTALQSAARNGATIVSINPLKEAGLSAFIHPQEPVAMLKHKGTTLTEIFVPLRVNGDVALINGIAKALFEFDAKFDEAFIEERTEGFEQFKKSVEDLEWSKIETGSGVSRAQIVELANVWANSKSIISTWAMGITQHVNGVDNVKAIVNLMLLGGHVGRPGAGLCPVRGHSNVQGDRTVGIIERPKAAFLEKLGSHYDFVPPSEHGFDTVHAIKAMHDGRVKNFLAMGGNFLSASPDTEFTAQALRNCDLTVHISTKLNRSHLVHGKQALILPCLGRSESDAAGFVTVENSMGIVHTSIGTLPRASKHLRSEVQIVCEMGAAVTGEDFWTLRSADYDLIRSDIESCVAGFDDYNTRVREPNGFALPNGPRIGEFPTETGKAYFSVTDIPEFDLADDEFMMMTVRSHDQFNTTIYTDNDRYRGIKNGRRIVFLNLEDIRDLGLDNHGLVTLQSSFGGELRSVQNFRAVAYDVPKRTAVTYFPEANPLVPIDQFARGSHTPASKSVKIKIMKGTV